MEFDRLNDLKAKDTNCVSGILKFLRRTANWNTDHEFWHVRQLCVEDAIRGIDSQNAPYALRFSKECKSKELYNAVLQHICQNFDYVHEFSKGYLDLDLQDIISVMKNPALKVQSEELLLSAVLDWMENSPYTEVHSDMTVKCELERSLAQIEASIGGLKLAAITLRDDVTKFELEVNSRQSLAEECLHNLQSSEIAARQSRLQLIESTQIMDTSIRELGGMKTELLFSMYKSPRACLQRILEALAVILGFERHWKATQKLCSEGALVHAMMQFDIHKVQPESFKAVYAILELPSTREVEFTTKSTKLFCRWVHSTATCVKLVSAIEMHEKQSNVLASIFEENRSVASALLNDLNALKLSSKNANASWMLAEKDLFMLELQLTLCYQRLVRTAARIERCATEILNRIKWNLVCKDFIISKVYSNAFVMKYILCNHQAANILNTACEIPEASFLHAAGSQGLPITWAQQHGRHLLGPSKTWDEILLSTRIQSAERKDGFTYSRTLYVAELDAHGNLAGVGCTSRGSLVAISGDYIYVVGGLDKQDTAMAKVFRARLSPKSRPMDPDDWVQIAFLNCARAFSCGGIMVSCKPWKAQQSPASSPRTRLSTSEAASPRRSPDRSGKADHFAQAAAARPRQPGSPGREGRFLPRECLFVSGGYSSEGKWLRSVEVLELPYADHWRRIHVVDRPRALATAVIVDDALVAVGGFDEHSNSVARCERVDVPLGFDTIGEIRVFR